MKKILYSIACATLALGFAACSSEKDEPIVPNQETIDPVMTGDSYVYVRLNSVGTRAGLGGFEDGQQSEDGTTDENRIDVDNTYFYFFTENGNPFILLATQTNGTVIKSNMVRPTALNASTSDGAVSGEGLTGVLILGKADPETPYLGGKPARVFCVANLDEEIAQSLANLPLQDMLSVQKTSTSTGSRNAFTMSSASYVQDGKLVYTADCTDCVRENIADAQNNPVNIYIERTSAKIRVKNLGEKVIKNKDTGAAFEFDFSADGITTEKKQFKVTLTGWNTRNNAQKVNIVKRLNTAYDDFGIWWNDPTNFRSYWAETPDIELLSLTNTEFDFDQCVLKDYNTLTANSDLREFVRYNYPHTSDREISNANTQHGNWESRIGNREFDCTGVLIRGVISYADDATNTGVDLVEFGGQYMEAETFKKMVRTAYAAANNIKNEAQINGLPVEFVKTSDAQSFTGEKKDNKWLVRVNGVLWNRFTNFTYWENGVTSYYVNIQHASKVDGTPLFGIVRNHIYETEVGDVYGLGEPGTDPKNPPTKTTNFLAAKVTVLNWRVVANKVTLE